MLKQLRFHLQSLLGRQRRETELEEEIRFHLAEETEEQIEAGLPPEQAYAEARRGFGNVTLIRELTRETWVWAPAERVLRDFRAAFRMMRRNAGYTCAVVLTLALGIGLNAAMYEMLSRLFLQPPHIENPDAIHRVWIRERDPDDLGQSTGPVIGDDAMTWEEFEALRVTTDHFEAVAGYGTSLWPKYSGAGQAAENLKVATATGELFRFLGVQPALGRLLGPGDDVPGAEPVVVISDRYWHRRFGRSPDTLGAALELDEVAYVIVGVLPRGFSGPDPDTPDVWLPVHVAARAEGGDSWGAPGSGYSVTPLVRRAAGVSPEAAADVATAAVRAQRAETWPSDWYDPDVTAVLGPLMKSRGPSPLEESTQLPLAVGGVMLVVLLLSIVDMSNLLMLRVAARRRELAVRLALGAGRWGVVRLLTAESTVLAATSGAAALGIAAVASRVLRLTLLPEVQWADDPLEGAAIGFTAVAALVIGLGAALVPALYASRGRAIEKLEGGRGAPALGTPVRNGLIVLQTALCLVLLVGAAIFYRSFHAALKVDIGYERENLLTVMLHEADSEDPLNERAVASMEARLRTLPGVLDVAQGTNSPLFMAAGAGGLRVEGRDSLPPFFSPFENYVSPNFFNVTGLQIREGRGFTQWDREGTERVAVVDATFAARVWSGESGVGRCLYVGSAESACTTVVGVVEATLEFGLFDSDRDPVYYLPLSQALPGTDATEVANVLRTLLVRTRGDPTPLVQPVLRVLAELFPDLRRDSVRSLPAEFASRIRTWSIGMRLFGASAVLAVLLAAVGLYSVIAFGVRQRELEFGIRRALGARASRLLRMVLARGLSLAAVGVVGGTLAALWAGQFVEPLLFDGRSPRDPLALAAAALVLLTIAVMASYFPARRAARADPRQALEAE
jgi:predicted permease